MIFRRKESSIIWIIEAIPRLLWAALCLRFASSHWLQQQLAKPSIIDSENSKSLKKTGAVEETDFLVMYESVRLASRLLPGQLACLPRSLALAAMLRKRAVPALVSLGVEKRNGSLASHAWVSVAGKVVGEAQQVASDFKVLHDYRRSHNNSRHNNSSVAKPKTEK